MTFRIALICLLFLSGIANADNLSEESVRKFVATMDEAVKDKDLTAIDKMLSNEFKFTLVSPLSGVSDKIETDKEGFLGYTRKGINMAEYYKSKRAFLNVSIDGNKAICTSELTESMTQRGMYMSTVTSEKFVIEVVNGSLAYTSYEGKMKRKK